MGSGGSIPKKRYQNPNEIYSFTPADVIGQGDNTIIFKASLTDKPRFAYDFETPIPDIVAIKIIDKTSLPKHENNKIIEEIRFLQKFRHPYAVKLYEYFETPTSFWLVMEFLEGGSLYNRVKDQGAISEQQAASITQQLVCFLAAITKCGFALCDIRSENILFVDNTSSRIKLINCGKLTRRKRRRLKQQLSFQSLSFSSYRGQDETRGNLDEQADMWGVGVLLLFMFSVTIPSLYTDVCNENKALLTKPDSGRCIFNNPEWESLSNRAKHLIQNLLEAEPDNRITAKDVLNDPWVKQYTDSYISVDYGYYIESEEDEDENECDTGFKHMESCCSIAENHSFY